MREVRLLRGRNAAKVMLFAAALLILFPLANALIITPSSQVLDEFSTSQEVVMTFLNEDAEPLSVAIALDPLSAYLAPYVTTDPSSFILSSGEQRNVRISLALPSSLPPQTHRLVIRPYPDASESATLLFRPPGIPRAQLAIIDAISAVQEGGESVVVTMTLQNKGNVVLFAKPQLRVTDGVDAIRNITFPRPVIIAVGESYPLSLRLDASTIPPGEYIILGSVSATDGENIVSSESEPMRFVRSSPQAPMKEPERNLAIPIGITVLIIASWIWWMNWSTRRRKASRGIFEEEDQALRYAQGEKHITARDASPLAERSMVIADLRMQTTALRSEVDDLAIQVRKTLEESQRLLTSAQRQA